LMLSGWKFALCSTPRPSPTQFLGVLSGLPPAGCPSVRPRRPQRRWCRGSTLQSQPRTLKITARSSRACLAARRHWRSAFTCQATTHPAPARIGADKPSRRPGVRTQQEAPPCFFPATLAARMKSARSLTSILGGIRCSKRQPTPVVVGTPRYAIHVQATAPASTSGLHSSYSFCPTLI
jgi:hypothetical protein